MSPFGTLEMLRSKPIPDQASARAARRGSRALPIDAGHVLAGEPLIEIAGEGIAGENYYFATRNPPYWRRIGGSIAELYLRRSVAGKLAKVNLRLRDAGLELFVFDAWRPRAVQVYFHDEWMPRELMRRRPALSGEALLREVERYWAAPTGDAASPAPHATGAAVDLTLRWRDGEALWMGSIFDDATEIAHRDRFEIASETGLCFSDEEARANRRLLHWVTTDEGFAGHPDEWWHFSWGDQLWSAVSGAPSAFYGLIEPSRPHD
ncbi:MAG: M15 family metallopeptidase [Rhizomicrobium sp.]|jgi:D-alanyl-D-alanine dipeptidase